MYWELFIQRKGGRGGKFLFLWSIVYGSLTLFFKQKNTLKNLLMLSYLKLIRIQNLLFIAFIQYILHEAVLEPILTTFGFSDNTIGLGYYLLMIATTFIAAGGYILNDYFDIKIDTINRPQHLIVSKAISRNAAMVYYQIMTGIGIASGLALAFITQNFTLSFVFLVVPGLLWFYSASYKRQFVIGNLVVAFVSALSVLMVAVTQLSFLQNEYGNLIFETPIPQQIYRWVSGYAVFAFVCTWIREIIKDMEDETGDKEMECRTMPIVWGTVKTKKFIYGLIVLTMVGLLLVNQFLIPFQDKISFQYILFAIELPLAALIYLVYSAKTVAEYHQASTLIKIIMLMGVLYCLIFYYLQAKSFGINFFNLFLVK